jgi:hypothetical protein
MLNNGQGSFTNITSQATKLGSSTQHAQLVDIDNDGDLVRAETMSYRSMMAMLR